MGIDVDHNNRVTHNAAHEQRVVTSVTRNPTITRDRGLLIINVFRRHRVGDHERDGNPLIYALKRKNGYRIGYQSLKELSRNFDAILQKAASESPCTVIVPMPSSASLTIIMARRLQRLLSPKAEILPCFRKATVEEALNAAPAPANVPQKLRRAYTSELNRLGKAPPHGFFQMKDVAKAVRPYFTPVVADPATIANINGACIMLVDDLASSGTTLHVAAQSALRAGAQRVQALCLLSKVD